MLYCNVSSGDLRIQLVHTDSLLEADTAQGYSHSSLHSHPQYPVSQIDSEEH